MKEREKSQLTRRCLVLTNGRMKLAFTEMEAATEGAHLQLKFRDSVWECKVGDVFFRHLSCVCHVGS